MRSVLHVIPSLGPLRGGPSMMVRELASALARNGCDAHIATTDDNGAGRLSVPWGVPMRDHGITSWYFPRQTRFYTFSWPLSTWLAHHVADFDLVHIHALFSYAALPAAYWARRRSVPYIVRPLGTLSEWGMRNRRPWLKAASFQMIESRVLRHAALVHYTSEQERIEAERLRILGAGAVLPNPIPDVPRAARGGLRRMFPVLDGRRILLFMSRIDPKKGLDLLFTAFSDVRHDAPDATLVIAGDGAQEYVTELKMQATRLGIDRDIVWTGFLDGASKRSALADADLFVLPSYSENFGIAVAEAMAAGVPVVVSDRVGLHTDVSSAGAGLVVPCDARHLARALGQLMAAPDAAASMGDRGSWFARERYSSDAIARRLITIYNGLVH